MTKPEGYRHDGNNNDVDTEISDETTDFVLKATKEAQQDLEKGEESSNWQYRYTAAGFRDILIEILNANDNTVDWFDRLRDFDFLHEDFSKLRERYRKLVETTGYRQLKWSCSLVSEIYEKQIGPEIGNFIKDDNKLNEIRSIFNSLKGRDERMITFVKDKILKQLNDFVEKVKPHVDKGNLYVAKSLQSEFTNDTEGLYQRLTKRSDELKDLVDKFNLLTLGFNH